MSKHRGPALEGRSNPAGPCLSDQRGIGLAEIIAATMIATLAVVGLAYSFGVGRGLIDRYQVARRAMGRAQLVVDSLVTVPPLTLTNGSQTFWTGYPASGTTRWTILWVDDPIDRLAGSSPPDPNPNDMKRILIEVDWQLGGARDTLRMSRLVLGT